MRSPLVVGLVLVLAGLLGGGYLLNQKRDVRRANESANRCDPRTDAEPGLLVCHSDKDPLTTAEDIADDVKPADRRATGVGVFLRYRNDMVAALGEKGGSRIEVTNEKDGYRRHYDYVGGYWGLYTLGSVFGSGGGRGEGFRGGGPGAGK